MHQDGTTDGVNSLRISLISLTLGIFGSRLEPKSVLGVYYRFAQFLNFITCKGEVKVSKKGKGILLRLFFTLRILVSRPLLLSY